MSELFKNLTETTPTLVPPSLPMEAGVVSDSSTPAVPSLSAQKTSGVCNGHFDEEDAWLTVVSATAAVPRKETTAKPVQEHVSPQPKAAVSAHNSGATLPSPELLSDCVLAEASNPSTQSGGFTILSQTQSLREGTESKNIMSKVAAKQSVEDKFEPDSETVKEVFVSSIHYSTTKQELRELFSLCGDVMAVKLPLDGTRRKIRGIGFVSFVSERSVRLAVKTLDGYSLRGRCIQVRRNLGKVPLSRKLQLQRQRVATQTFSDSPPPKTLTIFVGNLPFSVTTPELMEVVKESGARVRDCRLVTDIMGRSRGFAYVDLADQCSVRKALYHLNYRTVRDRVLRADYSLPYKPKQAKHRGVAATRHSPQRHAPHGAAMSGGMGMASSSGQEFQPGLLRMVWTPEYGWVYAPISHLRHF